MMKLNMIGEIHTKNLNIFFDESQDITNANYEPRREHVKSL